MKNTRPTDKEMEILQVLWERGEATVREVHESIHSSSAEDEGTGYTTTLKLMQIMTEKGLVSRRKDGKTHIYQAVAERESTQGELLKRFLDNVYNGSVSGMVMQLLGNTKGDKAELDEIKRYLDSLNDKEDGVDN